MGTKKRVLKFIQLTSSAGSIVDPDLQPVIFVNAAGTDSPITPTDADSVTESTHSTSVTLTSDGTDQTLTGDTGVLNLDAATSLDLNDKLSLSVGTDKTSQASAVLHSHKNSAGAEVYERSVVTSASANTTYDYYVCPSGGSHSYSGWASNDFDQGNGHRTIFWEMNVSDAGSDSSGSIIGDSTSAGGVGEGNFTLEGRLNDTTAQCLLKANNVATLSNQTQLFIYGQDIASLGLTDARVVLKKGSTDILAVSGDGDVAIKGDVGFYDTTPVSKPTITGSRGSNAALTSLLTALANLGLITDSTS